MGPGSHIVNFNFWLLLTSGMLESGKFPTTARSYHPGLR